MDIDGEKAPTSVQWGAGKDNCLEDIPTVGMGNDAWYRPIFYSDEWIEFEGYSKNGKTYTAKQLKVAEGLEALADDNLNQDTTSSKKITSAITDQLRSGDMVRVRAVNDAMLDKDMKWSDKVKYVKQAVNLYTASTMDEAEVSAEYDEEGQRIPF